MKRGWISITQPRGSVGTTLELLKIFFLASLQKSPVLLFGRFSSPLDAFQKKIIQKATPSKTSPLCSKTFIAPWTTFKRSYAKCLLV